MENSLSGEKVEVETKSRVTVLLRILFFIYSSIIYFKCSCNANFYPYVAYFAIKQNYRLITYLKIIQIYENLKWFQMYLSYNITICVCLNTSDFKLKGRKSAIHAEYSFL